MSALHRFTFTSVSSTVVLALGLASGLGLPMVGCQQPQPYCSTAHGDFAATYTLKKGGDPNSACGQLKGEVLGFQTYSATGGLNGTPKFSEPSMAILPAQLGDLLDRASSYDPPLAGIDPKQTGISLADFTDSFPDADEICEGKKFNAAELSLPELPLIPGTMDDPATEEDETTPDIPAVPATTIRYEWSNVKVLVSANYQGTQFSADLKYTQDDCTAEYEVKGLYPLIGCASDLDCCSTEKECTTKVDGKTEVLPLSSINPDFDVKCSTELGFCVLNDDFPALR